MATLMLARFYCTLPQKPEWTENKVYEQRPTYDQAQQVYAEVETPSYNDQKVYTDIEQV